MKALGRYADSFEGYARELSNTMKFRFLGLGFLWAWIYATCSPPCSSPHLRG